MPRPFPLLTVAAGLLLAEGVLKLVLGPPYLRGLRRAAGPLGFLVSPFVGWSDLAVRVAGLAEAILGWQLLQRYPVGAADAGRAARQVLRASLAKPLEDALDRATIRYMPPGARILDLGFPDGANLERLLRLGLPYGAYLGLVPAAGLAELSRRFAGLEGVAFQALDPDYEELPTGPFDLVYVVLPPRGERLEDVVGRLRQGLDPAGYLLGIASLPTGSPLRRLMLDALDLPRHETAPLETLPGKVAEERYLDGAVALVVMEAG